MQYLSKEILLDMLDYVRQQSSFVEETTGYITDVEQFLSTTGGMVLYNSTCMCLQTIGETIRKIEELTDKGFLKVYYPQIPWRHIIGMRNIISHEYSTTDPEKIFNTIKEGIPELTSVVKTIISDVQNGEHDDFLNNLSKGKTRI